MKRIYERIVKDTPLSFKLPSALETMDYNQPQKITRIEDDRKEASK